MLILIKECAILMLLNPGEMFMPNNNICKFITTSISDTLEVSCFVLESDFSVMKRLITLQEHRAILVLSGNGSFSFNGIEFQFSSGCLFFGFAGESFYASNLAEGTNFSYVSFSGGRAEELFKRFNIHSANRYFDGFDTLIPLWSESLDRANELTVDLAAESILLYTFSRLFGSSVKKSGIVGQMIAIAEEKFTSPELSLSTVADELSYNSKYLSHIFKEKMGIGYNEFLRDTRLKFALSLLDRGLDSIKNVALLSGFTDPLYFSTVFKKQFGVSPLSYIKKIRH